MISLKRIPSQKPFQSIYMQIQNPTSQYASSKCLTGDQSKSLNKTITERLFRPLNPNKSNIYLTNDTQSTYSANRIQHYPSTKSLSSNKIIFKSTSGISLKETQVFFTYSSPPRLRRHNSEGKRFSTKKFKEQHFPLIGNAGQEGSPIKTMMKNKQNCVELIKTREKTPEKHKILKNKQRQQRPKLATSNLQRKEQCRKIESEFAYNRSQEQSGHKIHERLKEMLMKEENSSKGIGLKGQPSSIEFIKISNYISPKNKEMKAKVTPTFQQIMQPTNDRAPDKKYPTLQSIEVDQAINRPSANPKQATSSPSREEPTSLRVVLEQNRKQAQTGGMAGSIEDISLARSISEELQLHYDYCLALQESDQSLSLHVSL